MGSRAVAPNIIFSDGYQVKAMILSKMGRHAWSLIYGPIRDVIVVKSAANVTAKDPTPPRLIQVKNAFPSSAGRREKYDRQPLV